MSTKWQRTRYPGVRFREHPTRRHGSTPDRYYTLRTRVDGVLREEALGWASEGMTLQLALERLGELKRSIRTGEGPISLREARARRAARKATEERDSLTFAGLWDEYLPQQKADQKRSWVREEQLYRVWLRPAIGDKRLKAIAPIDLERIKSAMTKAGRAPRSVQYCMALARHLFNFARGRGLFAGENPLARVRMPQVENRRLSYFSPEQAAKILAELRPRSLETYGIVLLGFHSGARFGEIAALEWSDVDTDNGIITYRHTKNGRPRHVYMTAAVREMLTERAAFTGERRGLVFPSRNGDKRTQISKVFYHTVAMLGFSPDSSDRRLKLVFHSVRHSYASWLVERGVDLFAVKEALGHRDLTTTQRYSHLRPGALRAAAQVIESVASEATAQSAGQGETASLDRYHEKV